jgi:hypothetical protein
MPSHRALVITRSYDNEDKFVDPTSPDAIAYAQATSARPPQNATRLPKTIQLWICSRH